MLRNALLLLALAGLAACDSSSTSDAAVDAADDCEASPFDPATSTGRSSPLATADGTARAGQVTEDDLPDDPDGLGTWRAGDFVLANDRVALLISDADRPREAYDPYGGRIVGVARVEEGALVEPADFNVMLLGVGRFLVATESVGVVNDGADGNPASIRATGRLARIEALADLLDGLVPGDWTGQPAAVDYELGADADHIDVFVSVRAGNEAIRAGLGVLQVFFQENRMPPWTPGNGFGERGGALPYIAFTDDDATSFAWASPQGELSLLLGQAGIDVFTSSRLNVSACESARVHVGQLAIGGRGLPPLQANLARLQGQDASRTRVAGRVEEADGSAATDARIHVTTSDGEHLTRAWPDADGNFDLDVDERAASLWAWRPGFDPVGPVAVSEDAVLVMAAVATIDVEVTTPTNSPLPARIEVAPLSPAAPPPPTWGERTPGRGRSHVAFATEGQVSLRVAPGTHQLTASHGPEFETVSEPIEVTAATPTSRTWTLEQVVSTAGVMCADYHIHTHRSVDSSDTGSAKLRGLVADGVEIAVRSEHEWVADFTPLIRSLGLESEVFGLAGIELTTFTWGHFGVFPLIPDERAGGGAPSWYQRNAPEVFADVRSRPESPALIINHPRAGGLRQAYFTEAGYDPDTGGVARPELWDEGFSVIEVFNETSFEENRNESVRDWFSLLNAGRRVFAVGSSDSHRILDTPVGYPRTCLRVGVDETSDLTSELVRDATVEGRSYVSGGIYLEVRAEGGEGPGDTRSGAGPHPVEVVIRAAPRIDVTSLEIIVDGVSREVIPIRPEDTDPLDATLRARVMTEVPDASRWVVYHASGEEPFSSHALQPFAVSNPLFFEP